MTRPSADASWEALIAEQADSTPGTYLQEGEVLNRGDGDVPGQMRVSDLRYKGYVQVWDSRTGQESLQPWWLLWQTMRKKRSDGSLVFTRVNPHIPQDYGEDLTCPLSPDAPANERLAGMGFRPCNDGRGKHHIPTRAALETHLRYSHKRAWEALQRQREDNIREEDRELQREAIATQQQFMAAMMQNMVGAATAVAEKPAAGPVTRVCPDCGEEFTAAKGFAINKLMKAHRELHS